MMNLKQAVPLRWRARVADLRGRGVYSGYADRYKVIFVHVPKTAGQSIATALFGSDSKSVEHEPYFVYQWANPKKFERYFKFAFVRNPWDRLVSAYFYHKREDNALWGNEFLSPYPDFDSFVRGWLSKKNCQCNPFGYWWFPQSYFLINNRGKLMVDFLGRFEQVQDGFQKIAKILQNEQNVRLPVINKSDHKHYSSYYTPETAEIVRTVYSNDVEAFGYSFENTFRE